MTMPKKAPTPEKPHDIKPAEWVRDMHDHYGAKGSYRAEDLRKVLGDPRDRVEMPSTDPEKAGHASVLRKIA
jgi:hypothetical protein